VFARNPSYDPRVDPVVRVEARRLRYKLKEYYDTTGVADTLRITLPKGGYSLVFEECPPPAPMKGRRYRERKILAVAAVASVVGFAVFLGRQTVVARGWEASIAVLPLENLSADAVQEYFADGMTDALTTDLAKIKALRVISRSSVLQFKRTSQPIAKIAGALGVEYLVEGTVLPAGNRVRVTAQLIAASNERHVWAESYEEDQSDILAIQSRIASAVATQIRIHLTPQDHARLAHIQPVNPEALQAYLKGRYNWLKRTREGLFRSLDYFRQAIDKDPNYSLAWAGLADAHNLLGSYRLVPMTESHPQARAAAEKAIQLDDNLAEAHTALATVIADYYYDWPLAEREFRRAVELNPSYATARQWHAACLSKMGRHDEAVVEVSKAVELDPLSILMRRDRIMVLYYARRYDEAIREQREIIEMDPGRPHRELLVAMAYVQKHMYPEAISELKAMGNAPMFATMLGYAYAMSGQKSEAQRILDDVRTRDRVHTFSVAYLYLALGDRDKALTFLEKAFEEREPLVGLLKVAPDLDTLHGELRFANLLRKLNLDR
jgi:TolB-like protein/Flp pilus assembly protein TadD